MAGGRWEGGGQTKFYGRMVGENLWQRCKMLENV